MREVSVSQRNCRYGEDNYLNVYRHYSYSACSVQCRKDAQLRLCNCTHHLMPNAGVQELCNLTGMACLNDNYNELAVLKAHWSKRTGLVCNCMPSCIETEMFLIKDEKSGIDKDHAVIEFTLERLPSERFKRNVVRGKLDLVGKLMVSTPFSPPSSSCFQFRWAELPGCSSARASSASSRSFTTSSCASRRTFSAGGSATVGNVNE